MLSPWYPLIIAVIDCKFNSSIFVNTSITQIVIQIKFVSRT